MAALVRRSISTTSRPLVLASVARIFSSVVVAAHQMGTCRMGTDPTVSVADTRGQLHDAKGVWIGDSSALPTALGVNPMITIMALARRTGRSIIDDEPTWT
ncbi:GMC family oxidoreductase [Streptomyces phaeochromogenes]